MIFRYRSFTGGSIILVIIYKRLSGLNARALYTMYNHITKSSLKNIKGEDVGKLTCTTRRLESCSHDRFILPPKIFTLSSCEKCNSVFRILQLKSTLGETDMDYYHLFTVTDDLYQKYQEEWNTSGPSDGQSGFAGSVTATYHNC